MSRVTSAVLMFDICNAEDAEQIRVDEVNAKLAEHDPLQQFKLVPSECWGGSKFNEWFVALGAFNFITTEVIIDAVRGARWDTFQGVQVLIAEQEDELAMHYIIQDGNGGWG